MGSYILFFSIFTKEMFASKDMQKFRLIGYSKLSVGVNVDVSGCLSLYVSPVMN